jgi:cytochrome b561
VYSAGADIDRRIHESLGLTVFALVVIRVLWRLIDARPDAPPVGRWMGFAAKIVQIALYLLLFGLPITAVVGAWLEGHPLTLLAGAEIPPLLARSHDIGASVATIHTWLGNTILWVAGLHAIAALYHHFVAKDAVLASMLPDWVPLKRPAVPETKK